MRDPKGSPFLDARLPASETARFGRVRLDYFSHDAFRHDPAAAGFLMRLVAEAHERLDSSVASIPESVLLPVSVNRTAAAACASKERVGDWLRFLQSCGLIDFVSSRAGTKVTLHLNRILSA